MTTCTTILGLLPLALGQGDGAELRAPLAIVVSFGLAASTLLTLFIIPCLYALIPTSVLSEAAQKALDREIQQAQNQSGGELDPT